MKDSASDLRKTLRRAGLSAAAIEAAWPAWWSDDAAYSKAARAELRFILARKLGLEPKALSGDQVKFVWPDRAKFKGLSGAGIPHSDVLSSFAYSIGGLITRSVPDARNAFDLPNALTLRKAILQRNRFVDLRTILAASWGIGIPVVYLRVFPLSTKAMHAVVVRSGDKHCILLGRSASYPAQLAYTLAHELGHACLGHVGEGGALVDVEDPGARRGRDQEEREADEFALTLLTGDSNPQINLNLPDFGGRALARAAMQVADEERIEPGTIALCAGYSTGKWDSANSALRHIYGKETPIPEMVNIYAEGQIEWAGMSEESETFVRRLIGLHHDPS